MATAIRSTSPLTECSTRTWSMARSAAVTARASCGPTLIMTCARTAPNPCSGASRTPYPTITPCFSRRSMRLCTLVRERPTNRANCAVDARALSRSAKISFSSMASMTICLFYPTYCRIIPLIMPKMTLPFAGQRWENNPPPCGVFDMKQIVVVGAGKIGSMIAELLGGSGDYAVTVVDRSQQQLDRLETTVATTKVAADITHGDALQKILKGKFAVLSAAPYHATRLIAEAAKAAGAHYLDLTEDVASTRVVKHLAAGSRTAFIPQCGLAPGFITIVASDLASRFDELQDVRMRVGALPKFPSNALNYNLTWSTAGVIK